MKENDLAVETTAMTDDKWRQNLADLPHASSDILLHWNTICAFFSLVDGLFRVSEMVHLCVTV